METIPSKSSFRIAPAGCAAYISLFVVIALVAAGIIYFTLAAPCPFAKIITLAIMVLVLLLLLIIAWSIPKVTFEFAGDTLRIRNCLYGMGKKFSPADLNIHAIQVIDISQSEYKPRWKTNGVGLPGYGEGWFRLRNKEKALLFITDLTKVVIIPTHKKHLLMLSPKEPENFVRALQDWCESDNATS